MQNHPLIVANWKMNFTLADAILNFQQIKNGLEPIDDIRTVICPPFTFIGPLAELSQNYPVRHIALGAQNVSQFEKGAYTGEVSSEQLKGMVEYCIVGHSERVQHYHETPELTNIKVKNLLKNNISPIVCIGEEEKSDKSVDRVLSNAKKILHGIEKEHFSALTLAYEPVWAISSNKDSKPATGEYAQKICHQLAENYPQAKIIYGGSVDSKNIREFTVQENIEGALVGSASLDIKEFLEILKNA